jgi:hypothetical protein
VAPLVSTGAVAEQVTWVPLPTHQLPFVVAPTSGSVSVPLQSTAVAPALARH